MLKQLNYQDDIFISGVNCIEVKFVIVRFTDPHAFKIGMVALFPVQMGPSNAWTNTADPGKSAHLDVISSVRLDRK